MKKILVFCLVFFASIMAPTMTLAGPSLEISINEWDQTGSFDYTLYYPNSSRVISKVCLPQDQLRGILNLKYHLANEKDFIKLRFGQSMIENKGRGYDSDWSSQVSDAMTDYGELDAYGNQKIIAIHFGTALLKNEAHQTNLLLGWLQQETTNELKNIVYHRSEGIDIGDQPQSDNGSYLDGEFSGLTLGINDDLFLRANLKLTTELSLLFLNTEAYGHWANHDPAWNWKDTGKTVGYMADIGLKYAFNSNIHAELGYCYYYAKANECKETLNGTMLPQLVNLEYQQKGWHLGLVMLFK